MPPMVNDINMSDSTYANFVDTVKILEAKGLSRAEALDRVVADGLKPHAKKLEEFRAFAAKSGEVTGA